MSKINNFEITRKKILEDKLRTRSINTAEADELKGILEKEKKQADSLGDVGKALGILLLIGLLIALFKED